MQYCCAITNYCLFKGRRRRRKKKTNLKYSEFDVEEMKRTLRKRAIFTFFSLFNGWRNRDTYTKFSSSAFLDKQDNAAPPVTLPVYYLVCDTQLMYQ